MKKTVHFPLYILDTFTTQPFSGNPTGVCILDGDSHQSQPTEQINRATMQLIATELQFPVTAFIKTRAISVNEYNIWYYTPTTEIPACGHATLAAANVVQSPSSIFHTIANVRIPTRTDGERVIMRYPRFAMESCGVSAAMLAGLDLEQYASAGFSPHLETLFIELADAAALRTLQPDYSALVASSSTLKEVVITSASDDHRYDYLLRSFCPWIGIDEDPVTGSVHSVLAAFWGERLQKDSLTAYQASQRGGELFLGLLEDGVELGGHSVCIMNGTLNL